MNKYLEKIAALNPVAKVFARKVAGSVAGNPAKINSVYSATSGVVSKRMGGVLSSAEKANVGAKIKTQADKIVGTGQLYQGEAVRAARAGARLARMQANKVA
jgi:hypothetical protein